jgi:outer membrane protein TolC
MKLPALSPVNSMRLALLLLAVAAATFAQREALIESPAPPRFVGGILKPFHLEKRLVPPIRLVNTPRLESLVRAGILYLSAQDVIALVLENNLDIAIQRYSPLVAREVLRRAEGGGLLRQMDAPVVVGPTSVSTTGISSSGNGLAGGAGIGGGGGTVSQTPPFPPNLDANLFLNFSAQHLSQPQNITTLVGTTAFTSDVRSFFFQYSQQWLTGTSGAFSFFNQRQRWNSSSPPLNPILIGYFDVTINQQLLQSFGRAVNSRNIRVAKNNLAISNLQVKLQVATTVSAVPNLYWDLVSFKEAVRIKEKSLETAQSLHDGNKKQVEIGALPAIEVTRAAADVSSSREDLLIAQTNLTQQEIVLKNALSRNGIENSWMDDLHIVSLDHIEVHKTEEVGTEQDLISEALKNRVEVETKQINVASQEILLNGSRNGLLPTLSVFAEVTNHGLSGPVNPLRNGSPGAYVVGGDSEVLSQLLRRSFPDYSGGFSLSIPFRNRQAQGDYMIDQLQLRQSELQLQRVLNQVRVDVKTALIGLEQAQSRYETAVEGRSLAEKSLEAEQKRFQSGVSNVPLVIQAQKDLGSKQDVEVQAMANYTHARIAFDMALGRTLEANHIGMEEALMGQAQHESTLPRNLPPTTERPPALK